VIKAADLYSRTRRVFRAVRPRAGKTLGDAVSECARRSISCILAGQAANAERDTNVRGVIACISPWNFPLAISPVRSRRPSSPQYGGRQTGRATPLIAARAVALLHQAGIPKDALQLLPGDGSVGAR